MTDNIFTAREREKAIVQSQRLQTKFEDADLSRENLLKLQGRGATKLLGDNELTKLQQQRLKKRLRGKGGPQKKAPRKKKVATIKVSRGPGRAADNIGLTEAQILQQKRHTENLEVERRKIQLEDVKSQREFVLREGEFRQRDI